MSGRRGIHEELVLVHLVDLENGKEKETLNVKQPSLFHESLMGAPLLHATSLPGTKRWPRDRTGGEEKKILIYRAWQVSFPSIPPLRAFLVSAVPFPPPFFGECRAGRRGRSPNGREERRGKAKNKGEGREEIRQER